MTLAINLGAPPTPPQTVEWGEQAAKVMVTLPPLILTVLLIYVVWLLRDSLVGLAGRLTDLEAFGLKLSLSGQQAMSAAVDMARKNDDWEADSPIADQKRALDRATKERVLIDGAELLWVDDVPSNNRNEARMLRSFGAMITFACTTDEALRALDYADHDQRPFDLILSDISREYPTPDPQAGLHMLPKLHAARHFQSVIFYVGKTLKGAGPPPGAFGLTARPDELLDLVLDALARKRPS